jgi:hypothetical protein
LTTLPLATALVAGLVHALEPDHMAAVTAFVSRRPHPLRALGFGIRWGLGHSAALLVAGGAALLLRLEIPGPVVGGLEFAVGMMLIGLGGWSVAGVIRPQAEKPHSHAAEAAAGATWVGAAHGLAGTAGFLAIVPAVMLASPWSAGGYLLLFGIGTVSAMGAYALLAGALFHRAGVVAPKLAVGMRLSAATAGMLVGALWIHQAVG